MIFHWVKASGQPNEQSLWGYAEFAPYFLSGASIRVKMLRINPIWDQSPLPRTIAILCVESTTGFRIDYHRLGPSR